MDKKAKVFLGGTCNNSTWRNRLIDNLKIDYFNPVVEDWTPECQTEEERQKNDECNIHLYVITPLMTGTFSIAEAVESSHDSSKKTYFCYLDKDDGKEFEKFQVKSLKATADLIKKNGGKTFTSLDELIKELNNEK